MSDPAGRVAVPVQTLRRAPGVVATIVDLAIEREAVLIVVGLPRSLSGSEGTAAAKSRAFAAELAAVSSVPVRLVDERLSTVSASAQLRASGHDSRSGRAVVDQAAATVILQSALEMRVRQGEDVGELVTPRGAASS